MLPHDGVYLVWVQQEDHTAFSMRAHLMMLPADPLVMRVVCRAQIYRFRVAQGLGKSGRRFLLIPNPSSQCLACQARWTRMVWEGVVRPKDIPTEYGGPERRESW